MGAEAAVLQRLTYNIVIIILVVIIVIEAGKVIVINVIVIVTAVVVASCDSASGLSCESMKFFAVLESVQGYIHVGVG